MTAQIINKDGVATFDIPEAIEDLEEVKYTYTYAEASNYGDESTFYDCIKERWIIRGRIYGF